MRILLDTQIVLGLLRKTLAARYPAINRIFLNPATTGFVSTASLWEIAIKSRLGKLDPGMQLADIGGYLAALGIIILPIEMDHVIALPDPEPVTRDPFDRLLLAQCQVEKLRFVTLDRALAGHRLAVKA